MARLGAIQNIQILYYKVTKYQQSDKLDLMIQANKIIKTIPNYSSVN